MPLSELGARTGRSSVPLRNPPLPWLGRAADSANVAHSEDRKNDRNQTNREEEGAVAHHWTKVRKGEGERDPRNGSARGRGLRSRGAPRLVRSRVRFGPRRLRHVGGDAR